MNDLNKRLRHHVTGAIERGECEAIVEVQVRRPKVGETIRVGIPTGRESCRVLAVHALGTVDVESVRTGRCYRVTGLGWL